MSKNQSVPNTAKGKIRSENVCVFSIGEKSEGFAARPLSSHVSLVHRLYMVRHWECWTANKPTSNRLTVAQSSGRRNRQVYQLSR
jgi:hypothetical protein